LFSADARQDPSLPFRLAALRRHLALIKEHQPDTPPSQIKNHAGRYFKGIPGGSALRREIFSQISFAGLEELVTSFS
jgi:tRNA-dihydrouridine synthase B